MGALWGAAAMLAWGAGDFLGRGAALRVGLVRMLFWAQLAGILPVALAIPFVGVPPVPDPTDLGRTLLLMAAIAVPLWLANLAYFRGLVMGSPSAVSAVGSSWVAVTALLAVLLLGETLDLRKGAGMAVVLVGIVAASLGRLDGQGRRRTQGVGWAVLAMALVGTAFVLWKPLTGMAGPLFAVAGQRLLTALLLGAWMLKTRSVRADWNGRAVALVAAAGALDGAAYAAYTLGIQGAPVTLVAPIAGAHPVVTIILARALMRDRLAPWQYGGIALALAGSAALGAMGAG